VWVVDPQHLNTRQDHFSLYCFLFLCTALYRSEGKYGAYPSPPPSPKYGDYRWVLSIGPSSVWHSPAQLALQHTAPVGAGG
jgi:hypothetical protein